MITPNQRDTLGGGLRLTFLGLAIIALVELVLRRQMALLFPYLNPELLRGLFVLAIVGYLVPGVLLIGLTPAASGLNAGAGNRLGTPKKTLFALAAGLACVGVLGIRTGVALFILLREKLPEPDNEEQGTNGILAYRLYLMASAVYLFAFGALFLGVYVLIQVVTVDLMYPDVLQSALVALNIWTWVCFIAPATVFVLSAAWVRPAQSSLVRGRQQKIIAAGAILAVFSVFGVTSGINLMRSRWMVPLQAPKVA